MQEARKVFYGLIIAEWCEANIYLIRNTHYLLLFVLWCLLIVVTPDTGMMDSTLYYTSHINLYIIIIYTKADLGVKIVRNLRLLKSQI